MAEIGTHTNDWNKHFALMADIDLSGFGGNSFNPIGESGTPFSGSFDGRGHVIQEFNFVNEQNFAGLFEYVGGSSAIIKNLGVVDSNIDAGNNGTGMIVGILNSGTITNCWTDNCTVSGTFYVGGIVGESHGIVSFCYSKRGSVSGEYQIIGGLIGQNEGTVTNCYSQCSVTAGNSYVGGFVGKNTASISNCYSTGAVIGGSQRGGFCWVNSGTITGSYWDTLTSGFPVSNGGTGKSTSQMKTQSTFAGWDFVGETANGTDDIWRMCVDGQDYPRLKREFIAGDFACPDGDDFVDYSALSRQWMLEKLSYDVAPAGGNGIVDFSDFAVFADSWQGDMIELSQFMSQWLQRGMYNADIAPAGNGDGIINTLDFAVFAENWLESE
jgi:hypothetical protein